MKTFLRKHTPEPIWIALKSAKKSAKKLVLRAAKLEHRKGILFIGYAEGDLGLGHTFRNDLLAAARTRLPFAVYPFNVGVETRRIGAFMPERYDKTHAYDGNIIEVAPDQTPEVLEFGRSTHNVLHLQCPAHLLGITEGTKGLATDAERDRRDLGAHQLRCRCLP